MATFQDVRTISMIAGENLNGDMYKLLTVDSTGRVVLATAVTDVIIGILAEDPELDLAGDDSTGRVVSVARINGSGIVNAIALGAVSAGNIAIWGTGALVTEVADINALAANSFAVGVFKEDGVANQVVEIVAMPMTSSASA